MSLELMSKIRAESQIISGNEIARVDWGSLAGDGLTDDTYCEPTKNVIISPKVYFNFAKSKLTKIEQKDLKQRISKLVSMLKYSESMNQLAIYDECAKSLSVIFLEQKLLTLGIDKYITKLDLLKFIHNVKDKVVKVKDFTEFPRVVPKKVRKVYNDLRDKNVFDEFVIAYVDYSKEEIKSTKQQIREKDPILFGKVSSEPDKYYFIIDWIDEYCDLTLSQIIDKLTKFDSEYEVAMIEDISLSKIKRLKKEIANKSEKLQQANRNTFVSLMNSENKVSNKIFKIINKIRGK